MRTPAYSYRKFLVGCCALMLAGTSIQGATTFTVTSTADPGNGVCTAATTGDGCTLREAIAAANSVAGDDTIVFAAGVTGSIELVAVLPDLTTNITITGPGADLLTVRRNTGGTYRIFHVLTTGFVTISGLTLSDGTGGIISDTAATLTVTNCTLSGNATSVGLGGAIYNHTTGAVNVSNCTFTGNSASRGGAIFINSTATLTVTDSTFTGNQSGGGGNNSGGAIYINSTGTANITNSKIAGNRATASGVSVSGGGLYNEAGTVNVINSAIETNGANLPDGNGFGGGIFNASGLVNVSNCTIRANDVGPVSGQNFSINTSGGGIFNGSGTVNVTNSTLSNNDVFALGARTARGGAIFNDTGTVQITNSTVANNISGGFSGPTMFGGGIFNVAGTVRVKSTIIAQNLVLSQEGTQGSNPDVSGTFISQGFNLIGKRDGGSGFTQATDQTGTVASPLDPKFSGGISGNGGPTFTLALRAGSPALDKGSAQCLTCGLTGVLSTDQRGLGFPRTLDDPRIANATGGDGTDIGAFELQTVSPVLANISTRLRVEAGDDALIAGFIITGTQPKKVILRAIGPSLGLPGQLSNPKLELFSGSTLLATNDDWQNQPAADRQAVIDSTIPPTNDFEAAIVRTLPANNSSYTVIVRGSNGETGIGIVEAFDLDRTVNSKLANISTRGLVQTGNNILIAGTIILGSQSQKVIVRGIGPSLSLPGKLGNPTLELRNQNGALIQSNDDWMVSSNKQDIIDSTIPPTNDLESAIVQTLPSNGAQYTAILRGLNDTTGVAVVEVYALN